MIFMKAMSSSSTTTALMADKYTADHGSGADDDGKADYTTRRLVVGKENADNGQWQQPNWRSKGSEDCPMVLHPLLVPSMSNVASSSWWMK
jgi:hypothetical protein